MRHALSLLSGIAIAFACVLLLHRASSLSLFALIGCGIGICLLIRSWAYNLRALRRASVRLRILLHRHVGVALPRRLAAGPFVRRQLGRVNPMWLSYALIAGWAAYEMLGGARILTAAPMERAAAGASSAVEAVAGTSAAIRAMSAVGSAPQADRGVGVTATALPPASEPDRRLAQTEGRGCQTDKMLDAFLPQAPVKEF